jgi:hypothetical protein
MKNMCTPALRSQLYLSGAIYIDQESTTYVSQLNSKKILASENSPAISYQEHLSSLSIEGNISSDYAVDIMNKAITLLKSHFTKYNKLSLSVSINKINTSGVKMMMNLLNRLKNYIAKENQVEVVWFISESDEELIDLVADMINLYGVNIDLRLKK